MTMKKFKDYRMFWATLLLFMFFIGLGTFCFLTEKKMPMIGSVILALIALFLLLVRYKNILMDDVMVIYEWKMIAMLPTMVDYKDILSVEKKSKHVVNVQHIRLSKVYVFDSDDFVNAYVQLKEAYNKTQKSKL